MSYHWHTVTICEQNRNEYLSTALLALCCVQGGYEKERRKQSNNRTRLEHVKYARETQESLGIKSGRPAWGWRAAALQRPHQNGDSEEQLEEKDEINTTKLVPRSLL